MQLQLELAQREQRWSPLEPRQMVRRGLALELVLTVRRGLALELVQQEQRWSALEPAQMVRKRLPLELVLRVLRRLTPLVQLV